MLFDSLTPVCCEPAADREDGKASASGAPYQLRLCRPGDAGREVAEDYIRRAFHRAHGATIHSFMPVLLTLHDAAGQLSAAVGYRPARSGKLYLEQYLDQSVEASIAAQARMDVQRHSVVEIGNLACRNSDTARRLVRMLPERLLRDGYLWVTCTATRTVRNILRIFDAPLIELGRADGARVAGTGDEWGSYYNRDPRVIAGYLPNAGGSPAPAQAEHEDH